SCPTVLHRLATSCVLLLTAPAATEIYTLSLHDAVPICRARLLVIDDEPNICKVFERMLGKEHDVVTETNAAQALLRIDNGERFEDRKSTRLNSSHVKISYAVFCLKKKKKILQTYATIQT